MSNTRFAFGQNKTNGCSCPVVAAGLHPDSERESGLLAMTYDDTMTETHGEAYGVASEGEAKEAWMHVILKLESGGDFDAADRGREIADRLGWSLDV